MIHIIKGRYQRGSIQLEEPLQISDGTAVEVQVHVVASGESDEEAVRQLGMNRLEEEWDNPGDAIYDNWKQLYADRVS